MFVESVVCFDSLFLKKAFLLETNVVDLLGNSYNRVTSWTKYENERVGACRCTVSSLLSLDSVFNILIYNCFTWITIDLRAAYEIHTSCSQKSRICNDISNRANTTKKHRQGKPQHPSLRPTPQKQPIHDKRQRPRGKQAARRKEEKKKSFAHFNLEHGPTRIIQEYRKPHGVVLLVAFVWCWKTPIVLFVVLIPFVLCKKKKKKFNPALRRK